MPLSVLLLALIGLSFAAPLVRLSHAPALVIATWRLAIAMGIVIAMLITTGEWREWRRVDRRVGGIAVAAGVMLALHFWSWNASIALTTVAASVLLVNVQPVIVAAISATWLREAPTRQQWAGIGLAMLGAVIVAWPDVHAVGAQASRGAVLGDLLALGGAVTAALYYLAGRRLRGTLSLWPYVALVYGSCLVTLLAFDVVTRTSLWPQPPRELAIFAALAVGPMMLGHTGMNWALRYLPAFVVNLTVLGEPIGATLLAAALPGIRETPAPATLIGGACLLAGLWAAVPRRPATPLD